MKCVLRGCKISRPLFSRIYFGSWFSGSSSPPSCHILNRRSSSVNSSSSSSASSSDDSENESGERYDVVIAGGGIVGSALACALGHSSVLSGKRILLLEASQPTPFITEVKEDFSNRVSTINPSSVGLFTKLRVWDEIRKVRAHPVKKMHIWESCSDSFITYENEQMQEEVAFVVENDVIVGCLVKKINQCDPERVRVINGARVKTCVLPDGDDSPAKIKLEDGTVLEADLLIGADGASSLVRKTMGVNYIHWSYNQEALVATLELSERSDNHVAWQRFLPTGPIALLPLSETLSSLVWSNSTENARRLMSLSGDEFVDALNSALWSEEQQIPWVQSVLSSARTFFRTIGPGSIRQLPPSIEAVKDGSRAAFPLSLGHAANYVAPRVALVGDAAHRVHPLAGLGVNLGLRDVSVLTRVLETAAFEGSLLGTTMHLKDYESQSQRHVVPTMMAIEGLHRLYTTSFTPFVLLRSLGLQLTDSCDPLKQRIITHASS